MKVAIWLEQDLSGGVNTHLLSLLESWPNSRDEFVLFSNCNNPGLLDIRRKIQLCSNLKLVVIRRLLAGSRRRKLLEVLLLPIYIWWSSIKAKRLLLSHGKFDALLADNGGYPGSWPTIGSLMAATNLGIRRRLLVVHHEAVERLRPLSVIESCVDRKVENWATDVVCVSDATKTTLIRRRQFDPSKIPMHVVLNGIAEISIVDKSDLHQQFKIDYKKKLIGIVGRVETYKGHDDLINAIALLPKEMLETIRVLMIGSIEDARKLEIEMLTLKLGIKENVYICGYLDLPSATIMAGLDLLVSATRDFEGFGLTILEAMAVGTPVIATDVGGVAEFFDNQYGRMIQPGSVEKLADAIRISFEDTIETRTRAISAKKRSKEFSSKRMAKELHLIINSN